MRNKTACGCIALVAGACIMVLVGLLSRVPRAAREVAQPIIAAEKIRTEEAAKKAEEEKAKRELLSSGRKSILKIVQILDDGILATGSMADADGDMRPLAEMIYVFCDASNMADG